MAAIKPPPIEAGGRPDYEARLRGVRKNLILLDFFVYGRDSSLFREGQPSS